MGATTTAARYRRISDDREGREIGVGRQGEDIDQLADREGLTVVADYCDNDAGASRRSTAPRPDYDQMLAAARDGKFGTIIAYSSSRLTRRPREHEDLIDLAEQYGVRFLYVKSPSFDLNTAAGRRVARILAATDAGEAEDIAERVQRDVRRRAEAGEVHGGPRGFGVTEDGRGLVDDEAALIREWARRLLAGDPLRALGRDANAAGIPTVAGAPRWRGEVIRKILLNPRTAGIRVYEGRELPAPHPAILTRPIWDAVRTLLDDPDRRPGDHPGPERRWIGVGLYVCQRCRPATVNSAYNRGERTYRCLTCWRSWRAEPIDKWVQTVLEADLTRMDARARLLPRKRPGGPDLAELAKEADDIRAGMRELAARVATARGATAEALTHGLAVGERRLEEIRGEVERATTTHPAAEVLLADDPVAAYRALTRVDRRQGIIRSLMTVTLGPPIRGRAAWDPAKFITIEPKP